MLKLLKMLKPYTLFVVITVAMVMMQSVTDLLLPNYMSDIVNNGIVNSDVPYILRIGGKMLVVSFLGMVASIIASYLSSKSAVGMARDIRRKVFTKAQYFSIETFGSIGTSSMITRTTNDITQIQQVTVLMLRLLIMAPVTCVGGIIMALSKDVGLSKILLVSIPLLAVVVIFSMKKAVPLFVAIQKKIDRLNLVLRETLVGIRVIRAFNRTEDEKERFDNASKDLMNTLVKVNMILATMIPAIMLIMNLTTVSILWLGSYRISDGTLLVGDMIAFTSYAIQIMFSFLMISMIFIFLPRAEVSAERINEVLELKDSLVDKEEPSHKHTEFEGNIEFKNVTFRYKGAEDDVLKDISFKAKKGMTTAIIGSTGSGKSTLISLIPRFYDVSEGCILIDDIDIRDMSSSELRSKIGFVPQKALLFSGTIAENLRYGKEDATEEEIKHACQIAQASSFIEKMPDGYDSYIEQGGANLSGGQKQRLAIARALVRRPEIYIFDDSFSALDVKTDALLRAALKKEVTDATVIIVAQRVSTIMDADQIVVLDDGRIAGCGTHKELMENCGVYQEIVNSQLTREEQAS